MTIDEATEAVSEETLVARAQAGDRDAFEALVARHVDAVWRVVWRVLRHRQDTEDVVQEVFLSAYRNLPGFRGEAGFGTWLHRIAFTRALNHVERKAEKASRAARSLEDESLREPQTPHASPFEELAASELAARVKRCLERLPAAWRAILTLREAEGKPYEAIAATLEIALGTVRSRLARARDALKTCVEEEPS